LPGALCIQRASARVQKRSEGMDAATMGVRIRTKEREASGRRVEEERVVREMPA